MAAAATKRQRGAAGLGPLQALGFTRSRGSGSLAVGTARAFVPMPTIRPANRVAVLLVVLRDHLVAVGQHRSNHAISATVRNSGVVKARAGTSRAAGHCEQEVPTVSDGKGSVARNAAGVMPARLSGAVIAGFDVHLRQITFDCLDSLTGEVTRGRIGSSPSAVQEWVGQFPGREVHVAMEACTGWLFVAQAVTRVGGVAHLAETVETRALRGRKRRAKTDRQDALWLRELLARAGCPRRGSHLSMCVSGARGCICERR